MINRTAKEALLRLASQFPVIGITGPHQSGKSTLTKAVFPNKRYVTFDDRTMRELAISNPCLVPSQHQTLHRSFHRVLLEEGFFVL